MNYFSPQPRPIKSRQSIPAYLQKFVPRIGFFAQSAGISGGWSASLNIETGIFAFTTSSGSTSATSTLEVHEKTLTTLIALADKVWREPPKTFDHITVTGGQTLIIADDAEIFLAEVDCGWFEGCLAEELINALRDLIPNTP